jgi:hypothetical protein
MSHPPDRLNRRDALKAAHGAGAGAAVAARPAGRPAGGHRIKAGRHRRAV